MTLTQLPNGILGNVLEHLKQPVPKGDYWLARCPAHDDQKASLSVKLGRDGRVLLNCFVGCKTETIVECAGLSMQDLFPPTTRTETRAALSTAPLKRSNPVLKETYDYVDEQGALLYQVCRYDPKDFRQRKPDGEGNWIERVGDVRRVLYRLPQLIEAIAEERTIYLVEGEKDVNALTELGYSATTWAGGANSWRDEYGTALAEASVVVIPDNDDSGRAAMEQAAASITSRRGRVRVLTLPNVPAKGDFSDWFALGNDLDTFDRLTGEAVPWQLDPTKRTRWRLDELWENDAIMRPPPPVVPRLAWRSRSTLLAATEKSGKSTMAGYVAAAVSNGSAFLDAPCEEGTVLILGLEEFIGDVARRLQRFNANGRRIEIVDRFVSDPKERLAEIMGHVEAVNPVLTIVDTLMAYAEGVIEDATKSSQMQPVVQQLTRIAHQSETAMLLVHHARRSDGRYRDSSAIGGGVDVIVEVFVPREDADPTLRRARARGRVPVHGFDFRLEGDAYRLAVSDEAPIELRIVEYVRDHPGTSANDVVEGLGSNRKATLSAVTNLLAGRHLLDQSDGKGRKLFCPASVTGSLLRESA